MTSFMPDEGMVGKVKETSCSLTVEWEISNFFSLSEAVDVYYVSPVFYFSDTLWYLKMFPNGQSKYDCKGHIGIYLMRTDSGPTSKSVWYKLSVKKSGGKQIETAETKDAFDRKKGWGVQTFLQRSTLIDRLPELATSGSLTFVCSLRHDASHVVDDSLFMRLMRLSNTMNTLLSDGKGSDFTLKTGEHEFSAHKIILESRSEYFAKMLQQDMEETRTGVVNIKDIHPDSIRAVLSFIYSARADSLTYDNVFQIYEVADQYDLKELKDLCKAFILENLCEEHICDTIKLSDIYNDEELGRISREYFNDNIKKIVKTDFWKAFYTENQEFAMNLITDTIDKRL